LLLAPAALAQSASADPCPHPNFPRETPDGCQASDLPDVVPGATADAKTDATADSTADATVDTSADGSCAPNGEGGEICTGLSNEAAPELAAAGYSCDQTDSGTVCEGILSAASASASVSASASASASALPETGGPTSVMALASLALLVGTGITALGIIRRG